MEILPLDEVCQLSHICLESMDCSQTVSVGLSAQAQINLRLTGDPEAPCKRNPQLSPEMEEIILHALERNPSKRFASAACMKAELNDYSEVTLTGRFRKLRPPQLWKARVSWLPKIVALLVIQIAIFFLLSWWFSHQSHHQNTGTTGNPSMVGGSSEAK